MAQLGHLRANVGGITNGFPDRIDAAGIAARDEFGRDELIRNLAFGTPDQVTEKLERYRRLGVDQFTYGASIGLDFAAQKRSFALFIDEVMPAFA